MYYAWQRELPTWIDVCPLQLPGREDRFKDAPFTSIVDVEQTLGPLLAPLLDRPFAFFGHSLGSLLAFDLARYLRRQYNVLPVHLFVSATQAPHTRLFNAAITDLPDDLFLDQIVHRYNAIPPMILDEPEFLQLLLPTMRADFRMVETYTYKEEAPLVCPITAFGGRADERIPIESLRAWKEQTSSTFALKMFDGGHFFLRAERKSMLEMISSVLQ